jgi:hypothetical protein
VKLPDPDRAVVDIVKLREYCPSLWHEHGKHKAREFASALGVTGMNAAWLRDRLLEAASHEAGLAANSKYGVMYVIDFGLRTSSGEAMVLSGWIVRTGEDFPRLTTCYVKRTP